MRAAALTAGNPLASMRNMRNAVESLEDVTGVLRAKDAKIEQLMRAIENDIKQRVEMEAEQFRRLSLPRASDGGSGGGGGGAKKEGEDSEIDDATLRGANPYNRGVETGPLGTWLAGLLCCRRLCCWCWCWCC